MQTTAKNHLNLLQNHTCRWYDDTQPCKISYPNSTLFVLLEICYFYISQTKLNLDKKFYKVVYHHIIYMCGFFVNLNNFFTVVCTSFHEVYDFHPIFPKRSGLQHPCMHERSLKLTLKGEAKVEGLTQGQAEIWNGNSTMPTLDGYFSQKLHHFVLM